MDNIGLLAGAAVAGLVIGYVVRQLQNQAQIKRESSKAEKIIQEAKEQARDLEVQAKDKAIEIRESAYVRKIHASKRGE